jgi:hypothetical protein
MRRILLFKLIDLCLKLKFVPFLSRDLSVLSSSIGWCPTCIAEVKSLISASIRLMHAVLVLQGEEVSWKCLIQRRFQLSLLSDHSALSSVLFHVDFIDLLLLLYFLCSRNQLRGSVHTSTSTHHWIVRDSLIRSHLLLMN